jgi:heptosyltransferase-1
MPEAKFLVVRLGSLGDIVHAFPAVAALRETFSEGKIVWLTHPRWRELVAAAEIANEIWEVETRSLSSIAKMRKKIRVEGFCAAIDYQGLWKSAALPFLARIPRRIGFSSASVREFGVPLLYTERVEIRSAHVADRNGELSLRAGAIKLVGKFSLIVPPEAKNAVRDMLRAKGVQEYVVLSPGGGWLSKCWPAERFGELALRLQRDTGVRSLINYGPGEEHLVDRVLAASGDAAPVPYSGSFGQLMAVLQNARCVVAGDTGPMHLADALGATVVAIFGPTDPERNGPYLGRGPGGRAVVLRANNVESTYKREDAPHPSLLKITVENVLEAMREAQAFS